MNRKTSLGAVGSLSLSSRMGPHSHFWFWEFGVGGRGGKGVILSQEARCGAIYQSFQQAGGSLICVGMPALFSVCAGGQGCENQGDELEGLLRMSS